MGIIEKLKNIGKNTLYYPGCLTKFVLKKEFDGYRKILDALGVDYILISEEMCCGMPAFNAGYENESRKLAKKNFELFNKYKVIKVITNCSSCYNMLLKYKELVPGWNIKIENIVVTIRNRLKKAKITKVDEEITFHDPCHLGRYAGIYNQPREILEMLGYKIKEMSLSKENSFCCGAGAGLRVNNPELARDIAKARVRQAREKAGKLVTFCPLCFAHLQENSDLGKANFSVDAFPNSSSPEQKSEGLEEIAVEDFCHAVGRALGIDVQKTEIKTEKLNEIGKGCA